jgi:hypothetical protein
MTIHRIILAVVVMLSATGFDANAQVCSYPDGFSGLPSGLPCSYSITGTSNSGIGCWATASCNTGRQLSVSFYQYWSCTNGYVQAQGSSLTMLHPPAYCSITGTFETYPFGLSAGATAGVFTDGGYFSFGGWDDQDCDGGVSFSGPFLYTC